jgi:hypothetical protein
MVIKAKGGAVRMIDKKQRQPLSPPVVLGRPEVTMER